MYEQMCSHLTYLIQALKLLQQLVQLANKTNLIVFENKEMKEPLLEQFEYSFNRLSLVLINPALASANDMSEANQDVAYLFWRVLDAHEAFYAQFTNAIENAPDLILQGLNDIPNIIAPLKSDFLSMFKDFKRYPHSPNDADINRYLVSPESEKDMGGYNNNLLSSFLPSMPKYRKYALILGMRPFAGLTDAQYNAIFAPKAGTKKTNSVVTANSHFLNSVHALTASSIFAPESTMQPASGESEKADRKGKSMDFG